MSLAHRVIPVVLFRQAQACKGAQFQSWRSIGHIQQQMEVYAERGCDELILLDIAATPAGRGPDFKLIETLTSRFFVPVTVGGGVRSVQDVRDLLNCGADKVAICTNHAVIWDASERFGAQAIVGCMDVKQGSVWTNCGAQNIREEPRRWADVLVTAGVGELLVTSIDRDGTLGGYDIELVRQLKGLSVPLIINGGCGNYGDMHAAIEAGADAVAASALFAWTDATPRGAAEYLKAKGLEVRT